MDNLDKFVSLISSEFEDLKVLHKKYDNDKISMMSLINRYDDMIVVLTDVKYHPIILFKIHTSRIKNMDTVLNILDEKDRLDVSDRIAHILLSKLLDNYSNIELDEWVPNKSITYYIHR